MREFLNEHAITFGISGTIASVTAGSAGYFLHGASVLFGFIAAFFSAGTAIFTFCIVLRRWRRGLN